jgi:hypothetical protein
VPDVDRSTKPRMQSRGAPKGAVFDARGPRISLIVRLIGRFPWLNRCKRLDHVRQPRMIVGLGSVVHDVPRKIYRDAESLARARDGNEGLRAVDGSWSQPP